MGRIRRRQFLFATSALLAARLSHAQQPPRVRRIGLLGLNHPEHPAAKQLRAGVFEALRKRGYREGENLAIDLRYADGKPERLPALAAELVKLDVEVIVSPANAITRVLQRATKTIPIVMVTSGLPVEQGFIESYARPGGNITGLDNWPTIDLLAKSYQILKRAVPQAKIAASLGNSKDPTSRLYGDDFQQRVATNTGLTVVGIDFVEAEGLARALDGIVASRADVLYVAGGGVTSPEYAVIAAFAAKRKLVSLGSGPSYPEVGGLLYYGFELVAMWDRAASYIDRILRGAKPADLPVEQPS
jgi:putative ABC transport system substrate-binding protein